MHNAIVISASSDIGSELCKSWKKLGWNVVGTFRKESPLVDELRTAHQIPMIFCDLALPNSINECCAEIKKKLPNWDVIIFASGQMDPIGNFEKLAFEQWEENIQINFLRPLKLLHNLLPHRSKEIKPSVLFFAGAGTNGTALNYSAYALSKISLIKTCELLDAEIPDTRFVIIGPGWVKTKIHKSTLNATEEHAGNNYFRTLNQKDWVPIEKVIECCLWAIDSPTKEISGRNFSVAFDQWNSPQLEAALKNNPDMYKLRRSNNSWSKK